MAKSPIDVIMERLDAVEKNGARLVQSVQQAQGQRDAFAGRDHNAITKAMLASGGRNVLVGADGASHAHIVNLDGAPTGGRCKALGLEKYWRAMYAEHRDAKPEVAKACWDFKNDGPPDKFLEGKGDSDPNAFRPVNKRWGKQKASLAESGGATGGYTVPTQFYADLLRLMAEKAFVRERCTVLPMQSQSLLVPALTQSSTTFARGQSQFFGGVYMTWTPEAVTMTETDPVFREIELVARALTFVTVASNQLLQDNAVALDTMLTTVFQEACAWSYDYYILQGGLSAAEPQGVITAPGAVSVTRNTTGSIKFADITNMLAHLYTQSWDNACWIANPSVIPLLMQMTNGAAASPFLTWLNPTPNNDQGGPIAQKIPAILCGLPIFWSEKASYVGTKGDIMLCDFSKYLVGDRLAIQVEVSPHVYFLKNQMVWRVVTRWDGQPWQNLPITLADQTWTVSPFVQLAT